MRAWDCKRASCSNRGSIRRRERFQFCNWLPTAERFSRNDGLPGDYEKTYKRALSVWDMATGTSRQIQDGYEGYVFFFPDGKTIALSKPTADDGSYDECVQIVEYPQWKRETND